MADTLSVPIPSIGQSLTTPFEDWCDLHRVHPEALGAWEAYQADVAAFTARSTT